MKNARFLITSAAWGAIIFYCEAHAGRHKNNFLDQLDGYSSLSRNSLGLKTPYGFSSPFSSPFETNEFQKITGRSKTTELHEAAYKHNLG